jgi:nucleotide-binding universal stress UspA family protein
MASSLLAFDGSPKAEEALYLATYLAGRWSCPLTVVTVAQDELDARAVQARAHSYLNKHGVAATYRIAHGDTVQALLDACSDTGSEVLLMGGYGAAPVVEVVFGSTVDEVMRKAQIPLLICR